MITTPESTAEQTLETPGVVVPITKDLHFLTPAAQELSDPHVEILEVVSYSERPEATLVAMVGTKRGRMEALIRVPREVFTDGQLVGRTSAHISADLRSLIF